VESVLCLRDHCLHLGLPLLRERIQFGHSCAGSFGRLLITTVHRIAELEQEPLPHEREPSEFATEPEQPSSSPPAGCDRVRGHAGVSPNRARLDGDEDEQDGDPEQDQPDRPVAGHEQDDRKDRAARREHQHEPRRSDTVIPPFSLGVFDRHGPGLVGR
jgi:hypothetical protein